MSISLPQRVPLPGLLSFVFGIACLFASNTVFGYARAEGTRGSLRGAIPASGYSPEHTMHAAREKAHVGSENLMLFGASHVSFAGAHAYRYATMESDSYRYTYMLGGGLSFDSLEGIVPVWSVTTGVSAFSVHTDSTKVAPMQGVGTHCTIDSPAVGGNPLLVGDCNALLHGKDMLDPGNILNWSVSLWMGDWEGIGIRQGVLATVTLGEKNLAGSIPPELGDLANVRALYLNGNNLEGEIPPELGNLTTLWGLLLNGNNLEGEIPPELGNLSILEVLYLNDTQLGGTIPPELGNLFLVENLFLHDTYLEGEIPPELGNLSQLIELDAGNTYLTGEIPPELGNLPRLEYLYLDNTYLEGAIPSELEKLDRLKVLHLHNTRLEGEIPPELGNLSQLIDLNLSGNNLEGTIPPEFGNLVQLETLHLHDISLEGTIPVEFGRLRELRGLWLSGNNLEGTIPAALENLTKLDTLQLRYNRLTGCIPGALSKFSEDINPQQDTYPDLPVCKNIVLSTETIDLTEGPATYTVRLAGAAPISTVIVSIGGAIDSVTVQPLSLTFSPADWNQAKAVTVRTPLSTFDSFTLTHTTVNAEYTGATLQVIHHGDSTCSPGSPALEGDERRLEDCRVLLDAQGTLDPSGDYLHWSADTPMTDWTGITMDPVAGRVQEVTLNNLSLAGSIPAAFGNLDALVTLDLGGNHLTGEIPASLGNLTTLTVLHLDTNHLTGEIPATFDHLVHLTALTLSMNRLEGCFPRNCEKFKSDINPQQEPYPDLLACGAGKNIVLSTKTVDLTEGPATYTVRLAGAAPASSVLVSIEGAIDNVTVQPLLLTFSPADWNQAKAVTVRTSLSTFDSFTLTHAADNGAYTEATLQVTHYGGSTCSPGSPALEGDERRLEDCRVLLDAQGTLDPSGDYLHWSADRPMTDWTGITIDPAAGRVQEVTLNNLSLAGTIPVSFGNLSSLTELDLSSNNLEGEIPAEGALFATLDQLYLRDNRLTGCIPKTLAKFASGINPQKDGFVLPVCEKTIRVRPDSVDLITGEARYSVRLHGVASSSTVTVDITGAREGVVVDPDILIFEPAHSDTARMVTLTTTLPAFDAFALVHSDQGGEYTADTLHVTHSGNCTENSRALEHMPALVHDCKILLAAQHTLDPDGTRLNWSVDTLMADWTGLQESSIASGRVTELDLSDRPLRGMIPDTLAGLDALTTLDLGSNRLTGSIPVALGNLERLQVLVLSGNHLEGPIPAELGRKLQNLKILSLGDNMLTDSIPATVGTLTSLQRLHVYSNALTGPIPPELGTLTHLEELNLRDNNLTGTIPPDLQDLSRLTDLHLSSNRLEGCIPVMLQEFLDTINPQQEEVMLPVCTYEVLLSTAVLELQENTEATYTVVLPANPLMPVMVDITGIKDGEPVDLTTGKVHVDTTSLLFTAENWSVPQIITVHARVDDNTVTEEIRLEHRVNGNNPPVVLTIQILDGPRVSTEGSSDVPTEFRLQGNYPNPFHLSTQIAFDVPQRAIVQVDITDLLGRRVKTLRPQDMEAGIHKAITVDMSDLVSGTYLYRLIATYGKEKHVQYGRMMLIK